MDIERLAKILDHRGSISQSGQIVLNVKDKEMLSKAYQSSGERGSFKRRGGHPVWVVSRKKEVTELYEALVEVMTDEKKVETMRGFLDYLERVNRDKARLGRTH